MSIRQHIRSLSLLRLHTNTYILYTYIYIYLIDRTQYKMGVLYVQKLRLLILQQQSIKPYARVPIVDQQVKDTM